MYGPKAYIGEYAKRRSPVLLEVKVRRWVSKCDMTFSNNNNLISHIRMHAGEKPYNCNECDMTFSNNSKLISHMRTHPVKKP